MKRNIHVSSSPAVPDGQERMRRSGVVTFFSLLVGTGCMSWTPGWEDLPAKAAGASQGGSTIAEADSLFAQAGDEVSLRRAITAYESALAGSTEVLHVHTRLAEANILYGLSLIHI